MKIKIYIVTYKNATDLNETLASIQKSDVGKFDYEVNIINNHSEFSVDPKFKVNILHNVLRPDFSTGHLSRNWNQALINGFKNLNSPDCDILVHCQDDTSFHEECFSRLVEGHNKYSFITSGDGDNLCSYTVDAVKKIGIWDERFCNIQHQDGDYYLRALKHNREGSSLNDFNHRRLLNVIGDGHFAKRPHRRVTQWRTDSTFMGWFSESYILQKYNCKGYTNTILKRGGKDMPLSSVICYWDEKIMNSPPEYSGKLKTGMLYPYFEKDIPNKEEKNYYPQYENMEDIEKLYKELT